MLNYPGMFYGNRIGGLTGVFAPVPKEIKSGGDNMLQGLVQSREPYIAECEGKNEFSLANRYCCRK